MEQFNFFDDLDFILKLAREAGAIVNEIYQLYLCKGDLSVTNKCDKSPLTEADILSHQYIVAGLKKITPKIPVVSEEDKNSLKYRLPQGIFWIIDPLDGTKEFLSKNGEFTINIGLVKNGQVIFGVIYAPVIDKLYWGGRGLGAFCENLGVVTKMNTDKKGSSIFRIVVSKSHNNSATNDFIKRFDRCKLFSVGSSLKFCMIAEGLADCYPRLGPTSEWDTAAAQAIIEAAGGAVLTMDGKDLFYGKSNVINPSFIAISNKTINWKLTS